MKEDTGQARNETGRGRGAAWPSEIPARGWWDIGWRVWGKMQTDRVLLVAAGATFYLLLALFPAMTAFVSTYGLFADPAVVARHVAGLARLLPDGGLAIIQDQLENLISQDRGALGFGFTLGVLFAYWSANNGMKTLFEALNIAYGETEERSFIWLNLVALVFTICAMITIVLLIAALGVVPIVLAFLHLGGIAETLISVLRWAVLVGVVGIAIALLYRFGPSRRRAKWRWITLGSAFATVVWLGASVGFSIYIRNFANYEAVYGSLGAVIGFMMWTWISVTILIVGAEINSAMEHQTARDSTAGEARPMGERGAYVADTLGKSASAPDA